MAVPDATARGLGVGRAMLDHLVGAATAAGFRRLTMETGNVDAFAPVRSLYKTARFRDCEPFDPCAGSSTSACMTRDI